MNKEKGSKIVVVTGDVTIDWNIARVRRTESMAQAWTADEVTAAFCQRGGAAMLTDLVSAVAKNLRQTKQANFEIRHSGLPRGKISPEDSRFHHSYAMWAPFKLDERKSGSEEVWRVQEFLGLHPAHTNAGSSDKGKRVVDDSTTPGIVILDDANLGFRDHPQLWPKALSSTTAKPWVLVKMARPVAQGKLWEHLLRNHAERLIVVMTVGDLRSTQVQISRQISWERTAQDLVWELLYNPHVKALAQCAHVIVSFGTAGAILLSRNSKSVPEATLFFDPNAIEGEWGRYHKGYMIGYNSCLTAGIARELMLNAAQPDMSRGIQSGIRAMRFLHVEGCGHVGSDLGQIRLAFPVSRIAEILAEDGECLATALIRNPTQALPVPATGTAAAETASFWTILEDKNPASLETTAEQIVREGLEGALPEVPMGRFGNLKTVDRREIESLHNISSLIHDYCQRYQQTPLSIAVFGPPGAGKSFAVREVADSVLPEKIKPLNFNLSQLAGPEDLFDAFHQVRDKVLSGKIPLVFWDEFDAHFQGQPLGWLRYFLAPMHDGEFQEGQITHPIGRSIFVFAGGTSHSMEAFGTSFDKKEHGAAKLPDFVSRLKGFLNILGPDRQKNAQGQNADPYYIIRRAIILRSIFERFVPQLLHNEGDKRIVSIDQGVLHAFLLTKKYRYGARSMEAIVTMSQLAGKTSFERSCLPSETQLNLHVDSRDFSALIQRMEPDEDLLGRLAEAFHEVFCEELRTKGWTYGPVTREDKKEHSSLKPYAELPEDEKEQNRNNVRNIPNKLASVGYVMLPARGGGAPAQFQSDEVEKLARNEHERWMQQKLNEGWRHAESTDKERKLHKDLVPWDELPEDEREKDRTLVRSILRIIVKAGYTMVKSG
jgi:hypothetical protein